jgi:hypothetical protein
MGKGDNRQQKEKRSQRKTRNNTQERPSREGLSFWEECGMVRKKESKFTNQ